MRALSRVRLLGIWDLYDNCTFAVGATFMGFNARQSIIGRGLKFVALLLDLRHWTDLMGIELEEEYSQFPGNMWGLIEKKVDIEIEAR